MKVSVIIPTKNRVSLLKTTLDNILHQSLVPYEVIVVDDGSTDGTSTFLQDNYKNQIILVDNKGKGPGAARNTGLAVSTGDFVKFFDSDDLMTLNCLEDQFQTLLNASADAVYGPYVKATENNENQWIQKDVIMQYHPYPAKNTLSYYMIRGLFLAIPTFLFKRDLLLALGPWNEDCVAYEDWEYLWRLTKITDKFAHTNKSAMFYRIHGEQTTQSQMNDVQRDQDKIKSMLPIWKEILGGKEFSTFDKLYLLNGLNPKVVKEYDLCKELPSSIINSIAPGFMDLWIRSYKKYNRWKTGTNWEPMHGVLASTEVFNAYHQQITIS